MNKLMKHKTRLIGLVFAVAVASSQAGMIAGICGFKWH